VGLNGPFERAKPSRQPLLSRRKTCYKKNRHDLAADNGLRVWLSGAMQKCVLRGP
jgi:hypothetical protein